MIYTPTGICAKQIDVEVEGTTIKDVVIYGGCSGQSQALPALLRGMSVYEAVHRLQGIKCGSKESSCAAEIAKALLKALNIK